MNESHRKENMAHGYPKIWFDLIQVDVDLLPNDMGCVNDAINVLLPTRCSHIFPWKQTTGVAYKSINHRNNLCIRTCARAHRGEMLAPRRTNLCMARRKEYREFGHRRMRRDIGEVRRSPVYRIVRGVANDYNVALVPDEVSHDGVNSVGSVGDQDYFVDVLYADEGGELFACSDQLGLVLEPKP